MPIDLKTIAKTEQLFTPGHRACAGCGATIILRQVIEISGKNTVVCFATGCMEVVSTIFPYTSWDVPYLHVAFENAAAALCGIEKAYLAKKKKGKIKENINFIAFGGDGGTYDIGLQALSGAMERGHNLLYICYDNGAYMNTGIQRSSATPFGAHTTTSPAGKKIPGKLQLRKELTEIIASHNVPYAAQASPSHWQDLMEKVKKALSIEGPKFMTILSPCPVGWYYPTNETIKIAKLAVETKFWPLYEIENGVHKITVKPRKFKPIEDFLKAQGRFKHMFNEENKWMIEKLKEEIYKRWNRLIKLEEVGL